jgi:hypothetical protein
MSTVIVHLASALICFASQCYPALVGPKTPVGTFTLQHRKTTAPGYGGDVLAFAQDDAGVFAIHRVWLLRPQQRRLQRLQGADAEQRKSVTDGCINVMPEVYEKLIDCCSRAQVIVIN